MPALNPNPDVIARFVDRYARQIRDGGDRSIAFYGSIRQGVDILAEKNYQLIRQMGEDWYEWILERAAEMDED